MTTQTLIQELQKEVKTLKKEVGRIESAIFGIPEEPEKWFKPKFIKELKTAVREEPRFTYNGKTDPLAKYFKKITGQELLFEPSREPTLM